MKKKILRTTTLLMLCLSIGAYGQQIVKGNVTSADNASILPGVNVIVKGSVNGTVTDNEGNYMLQVSPGDVLVFTFIGFTPQEITVQSQTAVNVMMQPDVSELEAVVIVGYGTQKKSDITGAVGSPKLNDIEKTPVPRMDQALQGRVAGVNVQTTDASPGTAPAIRIRGTNSISGSNSPLVVIDGLQNGNLATINPNDVESIEVLKDASATAIYGARGSNGVILVTTKRGKSGKPVIQYTTNYNASQILNKLSLLNAAQYAETENARQLEYGLPLYFSNAEIQQYKANGGTDWQDAIFRTGHTQNHQLSVSGGTQNLTYYLAGNIMNQTGIVENTSYKRYTLRSNIRSQVTKKLSVSLNTFMSSEINHPTTVQTFSGQNDGSPIFSALIWPATRPVYQDDGKYTLTSDVVYGPKSNFNPLALALEPVRDQNFNQVNAIGNVDYDILNGLKLTIFGSYRNDNTTLGEFINSKPSDSPGTERASIQSTRNVFVQNTNMLTYDKAFGHHHVKVTGVFEQSLSEYADLWAGSQDISVDAVKYNNLGLGAEPLRPASSKAKSSLQSYMGRVNYGYKDRYLLTLTGRADGSSVFGKNNKWGYFPSVAVGWNIANESFAPFKNTLSDLKLRASYGIVGNQAIAAYQSLARLNTGATYPLGVTKNSTGVGLGGVANPDLRWEKNEQTDIGLDLSAWDGRLNFTTDYYYKKTSDLLLAVKLPAAVGGSDQVLRNVGAVENKGWEFYVDGKPVVGKFVWETGFNIAFNKNKVLSLNTGKDDLLIGNAGLPGFTSSRWLEIGQPIGLIKGYRYDGVWKSWEATEAAKYGAVPGAAKYVDIDGDGDIDSDDVVNIGSAQPKYTYGWNNTFTYRNFDLNVFIQGVHGNRIYNIARVRYTGTEVLNRWMKDSNENTDVPTFKGSDDGRLNSSRWMEDGSYIRLKNVSFGYRLPQAWINPIRITSARLYVSSTNLWTSTRYTGFDPEASSGVDALGGVDLAAYPSQKTFTIGLDLKF